MKYLSSNCLHIMGSSSVGGSAKAIAPDLSRVDVFEMRRRGLKGAGGYLV